jgi:hypothetical protein
VTHWEGVKMAPNHWPGRDKVLALAATLKLMFGEEFTFYTQVRAGTKRIAHNYVLLHEGEQRHYYYKFKLFYDKHMMRLLNGKR